MNAPATQDNTFQAFAKLYQTVVGNTDNKPVKPALAAVAGVVTKLGAALRDEQLLQDTVKAGQQVAADQRNHVVYTAADKMRAATVAGLEGKHVNQIEDQMDAVIKAAHQAVKDAGVDGALTAEKKAELLKTVKSSMEYREAAKLTQNHTALKTAWAATKITAGAAVPGAVVGTVVGAAVKTLAWAVGKSDKVSIGGFAKAFGGLTAAPVALFTAPTAAIAGWMGAKNIHTNSKREQTLSNMAEIALEKASRQAGNKAKLKAVPTQTTEQKATDTTKPQETEQKAADTDAKKQEQALPTTGQQAPEAGADKKGQEATAIQGQSAGADAKQQEQKTALNLMNGSYPDNYPITMTYGSPLVSEQVPAVAKSAEQPLPQAANDEKFGAIPIPNNVAHIDEARAKRSVKVEAQAKPPQSDLERIEEGLKASLAAFNARKTAETNNISGGGAAELTANMTSNIEQVKKDQNAQR